MNADIRLPQHFERNLAMAAADQILLHEMRGRVLWLTLNRPEVRNAINDDMLQSLLRSLSGVAQSPEVSAVVLTGAGSRAFCAGGDLRPQSGTFEFDPSQAHTAFAQLLRLVKTLQVPLIARVNGHVMAGGMGLLTMCDMAVATEDALIGLPEVKVGMFPMQVVAVMQNLMGRMKFNELCLTGEPVPAREALALGLLNYVVPAQELDEKVDWLLNRLLDKSPTAIRLGKNAMHAVADMSFEQAISFMEGQLFALRNTKDAAEGIAAFAEKRRPVWTGT
jgi:methylglutaconyl-CoA hydratase